MASENQNTELAKSIAGLFDKYSDKLWSGVKYIYMQGSKEARLNWRLGYERYLTKAGQRYYYAKSFLNTNEPQPLYDFYVPLSVSSKNLRIDRTSIEELTYGNRFVLIVALGGSGKTMMMRHLFMDAIKNTFQYLFLSL